MEREGKSKGMEYNGASIYQFMEYSMPFCNQHHFILMECVWLGMVEWKEHIGNNVSHLNIKG